MPHVDYDPARSLGWAWHRSDRGVPVSCISNVCCACVHFCVYHQSMSTPSKRCTINDVLMGLVAGGLRGYLQSVKDPTLCKSVFAFTSGVCLYALCGHLEKVKDTTICKSNVCGGVWKSSLFVHFQVVCVCVCVCVCVFVCVCVLDVCACAYVSGIHMV